MGQLLAAFGAASAVVIGLYILKLRRRTVAVPFSKLWERLTKDKEATSLFSKLKRLLSLLLQLILLALLAFALGDPRAAMTFTEGRTVVVLIDASASMQATDVAPTRLGAAKEEVKKMIRGLGGSDRMLVAQMDAVVTPLGPMSDDTLELEHELDNIHPTDARADFARALRFASDALRDEKHGEIVIVSDGALGPAADAQGVVHTGNAKVTFVPVGANKRNVGITAFSVRRYPLDKSRYEVMLEVENTGPVDEQVELSLYGDKTLVDLTKLRLRPGERLPRFYPNLSGASRKLEANIKPLEGSEDALAADNHAFALLPERRRAKVLVVTAGNTYLEAALLLDEYLDVEYISPASFAVKYAQTPPRVDAVVFDGVTPMAPVRVSAIYLDPRGPGSPVKVEGEIKQPGFDKIERRHPIVRWTALDDVNIAVGRKLVAEPGDKVVGASADGPILVAGSRGGFRFVAMGFDVRASDLPLRVAWPLLLLNSINWFSDEDSQYISSFRTGDVWRVPVGVSFAQAKLSRPDGQSETVPVHEGRAVYLGQRSGFYDVTTDPLPGGDAPQTVSFAANLLDAEESRIEPKPELFVDGKKAGQLEGFQVGVRREIWIYLLIAAIILTVIEWATYHRRLTV
jgi:hypothetical protein